MVVSFADRGRSGFQEYVMRLLHENGETGIEDLMVWLRQDIQLMIEREQIKADRGEIYLPEDGVLSLSETGQAWAKAQAWIEEFEL